jgi:FPC/CPF motif-containing protein YcgG
MSLAPSQNLFLFNVPENHLKEMNDFILNGKSYPCIAAIKSMQQKEFLSGHYGRFGFAENWNALRNDLKYFIKQQSLTNSTYLTFWALFDSEHHLSEEDFESGLWNELSHLSSEEDKAQDWGKWPSDPKAEGFNLSIDGEKFFVVGLHPASSRLARRYSSPAIVFNLSRQFENLKQAGQFELMKETVRKRDIKLQGTANPMVLQHDDNWESIQYSGKNNSSDWKCPFHFFKKDEKKPKGQKSVFDLIEKEEHNFLTEKNQSAEEEPNA